MGNPCWPKSLLSDEFFNLLKGFRRSCKRLHQFNRDRLTNRDIYDFWSNPNLHPSVKRCSVQTADCQAHDNLHSPLFWLHFFVEFAQETNRHFVRQEIHCPRVRETHFHVWLYICSRDPHFFSPKRSFQQIHRHSTIHGLRRMKR